MFVETTNYYAKPGMAEAVLDMRRRGTRVRVELGLKPGRIFVKAAGDGPDVRWECEFASREELDADLFARGASAAFAEQRQMMGALIDRFERHIFSEDQGA